MLLNWFHVLPITLDWYVLEVLLWYFDHLAIRATDAMNWLDWAN